MKKLLSILFFLVLAIFTQAQQPVETDKEEKTNSSDREESTYYHMEGSHMFNVGLSFPNVADVTINVIGSLLGNNVDASSGPKITFSYEYGLTEDLGIGINAGYFRSKTGPIPFTVDVGGILDVCNLFSPDFDLDACLGGGGNTVTGEESEYAINTYSLGGRFAARRRGILGIKKLDVYGATEAGYNFVRTKNLRDSDAEVEKVNLPTFFYIVRGGARYYLTPNWGIFGEVGYGNVTLFNVGATYRVFK